MSNSAPSAAATRAVSAASRLTPEAHIAGLDDGGMAGGGLDLGLVGVGEAGRADDMDDAGLRRQRRKLHRRSRRGEVEHAVDMRQRRGGDRR